MMTFALKLCLVMGLQVVTLRQEYLGLVRRMFKKKISAHHSFRTNARPFCTPNMNPEEMEHECCKPIVTLFNGRETDSLESLRSRFISKKSLHDKLC